MIYAQIFYIYRQTYSCAYSDFFISKRSTQEATTLRVYFCHRSSDFSKYRDQPLKLVPKSNEYSRSCRSQTNCVIKIDRVPTTAKKKGLKTRIRLARGVGMVVSVPATVLITIIVVYLKRKKMFRTVTFRLSC